MGLLMGLILPSGTGNGTIHKLENIQIWKEESCLRPAPTGRAPKRLISTLSLSHVLFVKLTQIRVQTDFHKATVSSFWPFFVHSISSGGQ